MEVFQVFLTFPSLDDVTLPVEMRRGADPLPLTLVSHDSMT